MRHTTSLRTLAFVALLLAVAVGCKKPEPTQPDKEKTLPLRGADMSFVPEIRERGITVRNLDGQPEDMLATLKKEGVNAVRIRLWHNPAGGRSGFEEVSAFAEEVRQQGMMVWLTVHYSDTWADPGKQQKPAAWVGIPFDALADSVYAYTRRVVADMRPDILQVGNEINGGLLWPDGRSNNPAQMRTLLQRGIAAARDQRPETQIMLHYAGHAQARGFFTPLADLDFDLIGLSYYPFWHGKSLDSLGANMAALTQQLDKDVIIAETAYPFTFGWNDYTNNIIGLDHQILPQYPPTAQGQSDFLTRLKEVVAATPRGTGVCYWGAEWIAFRGNTATDGSTWENQALWDFQNRALPALRTLGE